MTQTFDLLARLKADVSDFQAKMGSASDLMNQFSGTTGDAMQSVGNAMASVGAGMTAGLTAPIVAGTVASVKAFADLESGMKGVQKTTDMTDAEISKLKDSLQDMSGQMPVAATELAGIAEAAGQLGIENQNILGFTDTIAKLGSATNLAYEEGATSLAQFANITQMAQTDFENLGSVIVELGNNLATTEADIVNMAQRLAATGSMMGLTEAQIMGLSGAMASVGIEAEAGGTAMSTSLKKIDAAVRDSGSELESYAKISGMTAEEFATAWSESPEVAISSFIEGLGDMIDKGEDANGALEALGITGIREVDTLLRLAGAGELTAESFAMASEAWAENTALSKEAETAWGSMAAQAQMLWNKIVNLAEGFGERLAPSIERVMEFASGLLDRFSEMSTGTQDLIIILAGIAAAVGPLLIIGGKLLAFAGGFYNAFAQAGTVLGAFGSMFPKIAGGVKLLGAVFKGLFSGITGAFGAIKGIFLAIAGVIGGPATIVIGIVLALAGAFTYLWQTNETFRDKVIEIWNGISAFFAETIPSIVMGIVEWFQQLPEQISETWNNIVTGVVEWVQNMWAQALEFGALFIETILQFFNDLPENIGFALGYVITKVIMWVAEMVQLAIEAGSRFVENVVTFFRELPGNVQTWISDTYNRVSSWATDMWTKAKEAGSQFLQNVISFVQQLPGRVQTWLTNTIARLSSWVGDMASKGREAASELVNATVNGVRSLPGRMVQFGKDVVTGFWNGIQSLGGWLWSQVTGFFTGIIDGVKGALDIGSPSRLFHQFGLWVDEGFANGIEAGARQVRNSMNSMIQGAIGVADGTSLSPSLAISTPNIDGELAASNRQINGTIDHHLQTRNNAYYFNLRMGRHDYELMTEDITEIQDRKQSISTRRR